MPQEIICPGCSGTLKVPDSLAGKKGKCPSCGAVIDIPPAAAAEGLFRADEQIGLRGADSPAPAEEPREEPSRPGLFAAGEKTGLPGEMGKGEESGRTPAAAVGLFPAHEKLGLPAQAEEKGEAPPPAEEKPAATAKESGRTAERYGLAGATVKYARADAFVKGADSHPVLDISRKGMGFKLVLKPKKKALQTVQLTPDVSPGDMLNVTVDIQAFVTTMKAKGRVTRVVRLEEKNAYLVGVEFTEMAPGEVERLKKLEASEDLRQTKRTSKYI